MSFTIFQHEKTPFQPIKTKSQKNYKIHIFKKGLAHGFGPKMAIFPTFFFPQCRPRKCILRYSRTKNASLGYKKKVEEVRKLTFFQKGSPTLLVQKQPFFQLFFPAIQAKKMSFTIFQNEKTPSQAIKTRSSKSRKLEIFPKRLTHGFVPKIAIFPSLFFRQYGLGKYLLRHSRTKKASLGYQKKVEQVRKLTFFQRGLPMLLVQKWPFLQPFFQAILVRKMYLTLFQNEQTPF